MTRKKFRVFMISFIFISIAVLTGFMIKNFKRGGNFVSNPTQNEVVSEGMSNTDNPPSAEENISYYVNENTIKKTKTISNEITMFTIEAKLFISNNGNKTAYLDPDAFGVNYDTEGMGLLYDVDYGNIEKPVVLEAGGSTSISFAVTYIIKDTENFKISTKRSLNFNYMDKQILVCLV